MIFAKDLSLVEKDGMSYDLLASGITFTAYEGVIYAKVLYLQKDIMQGTGFMPCNIADVPRDVLYRLLDKHEVPSAACLHK